MLQFKPFTSPEASGTNNSVTLAPKAAAANRSRFLSITEGSGGTSSSSTTTTASSSSEADDSFNLAPGNPLAPGGVRLPNSQSASVRRASLASPAFLQSFGTKHSSVNSASHVQTASASSGNFSSGQQQQQQHQRRKSRAASIAFGNNNSSGFMDNGFDAPAEAMFSGGVGAGRRRSMAVSANGYLMPSAPLLATSGNRSHNNNSNLFTPAGSSVFPSASQSGMNQRNSSIFAVTSEATSDRSPADAHLAAADVKKQLDQLFTEHDTSSQQSFAVASSSPPQQHTLPPQDNKKIHHPVIFTSQSVSEAESSGHNNNNNKQQQPQQARRSVVFTNISSSSEQSVPFHALPASSNNNKHVPPPVVVSPDNKLAASNSQLPAPNPAAPTQQRRRESSARERVFGRFDSSGGVRPVSDPLPDDGLSVMDDVVSPLAVAESEEAAERQALVEVEEEKDTASADAENQKAGEEAAAAQKREEERIAAALVRAKEEMAAASAAAEKKRLEDQIAADEKNQLEADAAAAAEQKRLEEEAAAAEKQRLEDAENEAAAAEAERQRQAAEEEAARKKKAEEEEEAVAKRKQEEEEAAAAAAAAESNIVADEDDGDDAEIDVFDALLVREREKEEQLSRDEELRHAKEVEEITVREALAQREKRRRELQDSDGQGDFCEQLLRQARAASPEAIAALREEKEAKRRSVPEAVLLGAPPVSWQLRARKYHAESILAARAAGRRAWVAERPADQVQDEAVRMRRHAPSGPPHHHRPLSPAWDERVRQTSPQRARSITPSSLQHQQQQQQQKTPTETAWAMMDGKQRRDFSTADAVAEMMENLPLPHELVEADAAAVAARAAVQARLDKEEQHRINHSNNSNKEREEVHLPALVETPHRSRYDSHSQQKCIAQYTPRSTTPRIPRPPSAVLSRDSPIPYNPQPQLQTAGVSVRTSTRPLSALASRSLHRAGLIH